MAAVTPKNVKFLGWEVTYYAKCTKSGNELTFSEQVGTSSNIGEGQSLNVYTHAKLEVGKEYTISETYKSDIPNYDFVKATIWERNIANGFKITFDEDDDGRTIIITNKYVKHGTVIKPGKLTIKKTVEGVDVPDNYEVTVNVYNSDKSVNENIKLNKANSFSHTLELEEDRYYIKETTFTDING